MDLFDYFATCLRNPYLLKERENAYLPDIVLIPRLDLSDVDDVAHKAIDRLASRDFSLSVHHKVVASFRYLARLRTLTARPIEEMRQIVYDWYAFLDQAISVNPLKPVPPPARIEAYPAGVAQSQRKTLTAFSLIEDYKLTLDQATLDAMVDQIALREKPGLSTNDPRQWVLQKALERADQGKNGRGGSLDEKAWDGVDLLALIIVLMEREGLKPAVADPDLQDWVIGFFKNRGKVDLGGAASNETYILQCAGEDVMIANPYHHPDQAAAAQAAATASAPVPGRVTRLDLSQKKPLLRQSSLTMGRPQDPHRFSFVLQLTPTRDPDTGEVHPYLQIGPRMLRPHHSDRVILRIPNPRCDPGTSQPWHTLRVVWPGDPQQLTASSASLASPGTLGYDATRQAWIFEIEHDACDKKGKIFANLGPEDWPLFPLFQHPAQLVGGVLTLQLASFTELATFLANHFHTVLLGGLEFFGKTVFTSALTELLRAALTMQLAALTSAGATLHFELSGETTGVVLKEFCSIYGTGETRHFSINREQLVQITSEFGSPYFLSPRPITPESPFTIAWRARFLLEKLGMGSLRIHDLELDILMVKNPALDTPDQTADRLERYRQATLLSKAAVPVALTVRSGLLPHWSPIFSTQSLVALLDFAEEYASFLAPNDSPQRMAILSQVMKKGYYYDPQGISVVVTPVIFVNFDPCVSLAGAGDMDFAMQSVMSSPARR